MRGLSFSVLVRHVVLVLLCGLLSSAAGAQQTTSGIAGTVRDGSGAVLPGVTVEAASPVLIEKVRSVVTNGEGREGQPHRVAVYAVGASGLDRVRREH